MCFDALGAADAHGTAAVSTTNIKHAHSHSCAFPTTHAPPSAVDTLPRHLMLAGWIPRENRVHIFCVIRCRHVHFAIAQKPRPSIQAGMIFTALMTMAVGAMREHNTYQPKNTPSRKMHVKNQKIKMPLAAHRASLCTFSSLM